MESTCNAIMSTQLEWGKGRGRGISFGWKKGSLFWPLTSPVTLGEGTTLRRGSGGGEGKDYPGRVQILKGGVSSLAKLFLVCSSQASTEKGQTRFPGSRANKKAGIGLVQGGEPSTSLKKKGKKATSEKALN